MVWTDVHVSVFIVQSPRENSSAVEARHLLFPRPSSLRSAAVVIVKKDRSGKYAPVQVYSRVSPHYTVSNHVTWLLRFWLLINRSEFTLSMSMMLLLYTNKITGGTTAGTQSTQNRSHRRFYVQLLNVTSFQAWCTILHLNLILGETTNLHTALHFVSNFYWIVACRLCCRSHVPHILLVPNILFLPPPIQQILK